MPAKEGKAKVGVMGLNGWLSFSAPIIYSICWIFALNQSLSVSSAP